MHYVFKLLKPDFPSISGIQVPKYDPCLCLTYAVKIHPLQSFDPLLFSYLASVRFHFETGTEGLIKLIFEFELKKTLEIS